MLFENYVEDVIIEKNIFSFFLGGEHISLKRKFLKRLYIKKNEIWLNFQRNY